jgi:hypothetical protein
VPDDGSSEGRKIFSLLSYFQTPGCLARFYGGSEKGFLFVSPLKAKQSACQTTFWP